MFDSQKAELLQKLPQTQSFEKQNNMQKHLIQTLNHPHGS